MALQLQDSEILAIRKLQMRLTNKYALQPRTEKVIDQIEVEAIHELASLGWIAHVDAFPLLQGEQMTISLLQRVDADYEFDHEKKAYDVTKAIEKGETLHGESRSTE